MNVSLIYFDRFIRMSSPQINNLIIFGCILAYTSVLLMGIDSTLLGKRSSESAMNFICAVRSIDSIRSLIDL